MFRERDLDHHDATDTGNMALGGDDARGRPRTGGLMHVSYDVYTEAKARMRETVGSLCVRDDVVQVCDVGGGAKPLLAPEAIREHGLRYSLLDVSADELATAPEGYAKIQADATGDLHLDTTFC